MSERAYKFITKNETAKLPGVSIRTSERIVNSDETFPSRYVFPGKMIHYNEQDIHDQIEAKREFKE